MLAFGTLTAELAQHRPTQNFITSHQRLLTFFVVPIILHICGFDGSYPQEHEDWAPSSSFLHSVLTSGGEGGSLITPNGSDIQRRTSAFFIMCTAASLFLSPTFQKLLSHRLLIWLGHHSFAVYLVHGTILRTVGMWIVFGIRGEPWVPPALNEDGSPMEPDWLQPKGDLHKAVGIIVFTTLTYTAAWAWMKWVDTSCARATQWLENRVFEDEDAEGKDGIAEKGFGLANGNGVPPPRPHHEREQPPP
jgi:hypothetical protein